MAASRPHALAIVFDLDGTLVCECVCQHDHVRARPLVDDLLIAAFQECAVVGVWTAASRSWYERVHAHALAPALARVSERLGVRCDFDFVWTSERCTRSCRRRWYQVGEAEATLHKRLSKLWRRRSRPYTYVRPENTLHIDNTPSTFAKNYGNGIEIETYTCYDGDDDDDECERVADLIRMLADTYARAGSIRHVEKRRFE